MKLSVVIPVFDRQEEAVRAVGCALRQIDNDMELIVVDDHSELAFCLPDDLGRDDRISLVRHAVNKGAGGARNTGIKLARGKYIAFLDSDDMWRDGKLAAQLEFAAHHEREKPDQLAAYVCGFRLKSAVTGVDRELRPISSQRLTDFASGCWFCPGSTLLIRRDVFDIVGGYDERLSRLEDLDWFMRFGIAGGRLNAMNGIFADIEAAARPAAKIIQSNSKYLLQKYDGRGDDRLDLKGTAYRYLKSYLALERASVHVAHRELFQASAHLARSFLLKPRLQLHLNSWWQHIK